MSTRILPSSQAAVAGPLRVAPRALAVPAPTVGVVIPCFNYAAYLEEAVTSCLTQTDVAVTVVIVDDCSSDNSAEVARELAGDPRVRLLVNSANQGPVATFNRGLAALDTEFVVRLDADDLLTPGSLARSAALARAHPSVGLVYGHPIHFEGSRRPRPRTRVSGWSIWPGRDWLEARCRSGVNVITSPEAFMRMSTVHRTGGQRDLQHTHDMEMWLRLAALSDVGYVQGADQAWHREHPASLSVSSESAGGLTILRERHAAFVTALTDPLVALELDTAAELRTLTETTLATEALQRAIYERDRRRHDRELESALIDFAATRPAPTTHLPEWRALARRQAAGPSWVPRHPWLYGRPVVRILRRLVSERRWRRTGVYEPPAPSPHRADPDPRQQVTP